eukprot:TRINITY_DN11589_c0_g1_i1.p1 TRINITY_DN11589_c0_g1~~TRINITY_DN11589_c0_g1_i1.p1  ORF type:complete len:283 (-),score=36.83 TRINITY_DN11589_c0_g1_i1:642-1415(-)
MAPIAGCVSLSASTGITFRPCATAVAPHHRSASSPATLLSSYDALASSRLSSTSGRSLVTGSRTGYKSSTTVCQALLKPNKDKELVKGELLVEIARVDRGAEASAEDRERIDKIVEELEALNPTEEPLNSSLINGKWILLYTTSGSILKKNRQKFLRPRGPIYQAINTDNLRAQNVETWPFFNQVTGNLTPLSPTKVVVKFDYFKIAGLIKIKAPGRARGELEITYLDNDLRVSRGDRGNLFILRMFDPSYRVPLDE